MTKLNYEEKINLYYDRKAGMSYNSLTTKYHINQSGIEYLVRLIDKNGFNILRTTENKIYNAKEKEIFTIGPIKQYIKENFSIIYKINFK